MSQEEALNTLLTLLMYAVGGKFEFTRDLVDNMWEHQIIWEENDGVITTRLVRRSIIIGLVDNDVVTVP